MLVAGRVILVSVPVQTTSKSWGPSRLKPNLEMVSPVGYYITLHEDSPLAGLHKVAPGFIGQLQRYSVQFAYFGFIFYVRL